MIFVSSLLSKAENICTSEFDKEAGTYIGLLFNSGLLHRGFHGVSLEKLGWEEDGTRRNKTTRRSEGTLPSGKGQGDDGQQMTT